MGTFVDFLLLFFAGAYCGFLVGWSRGFSDSEKIWKPHGQAMANIWKDAARKLRDELNDRSV